MGLFYGKELKVEKLSEDHKKKRVAYAKEMKNEKWRTVLFSDEKQFNWGLGRNMSGKCLETEKYRNTCSRHQNLMCGEL